MIPFVSSPSQQSTYTNTLSLFYLNQLGDLSSLTLTGYNYVFPSGHV